MMNSKKSVGSRKDPLKTPKVWERARREKMKIYFNELQEVLPFYDPSAPMSRFEILQKSKTYIKDLQEQNQDLLNGGFDEVYKNKMLKLKQRVKELLKRVDQLTDLLRTANIMIPPIESYPEGGKNLNTFRWMSQRPKKWTEKINLVVPDEKIKSVLTLIKDYKKKSGKISVKKNQFSKSVDRCDNNSESEVNIKKSIRKKKKVLKKTDNVNSVESSKTNIENSDKSEPFTGSQSPSQFKENQPVDFNLLSNNNFKINKNTTTEQTIVVTSDVCKNNNDSRNKQNSVSIAEINTLLPQKIIPTQSNVILPPATNVLQSNTFFLTNDGNLVQLPVLNSSGSVFGANTNFISSATMVKSNTGLLTPIVINKPPPVIVIQKPSPQIIQTAQIINTSPQLISVSKPSIQILGSSIVYTSSNTISSAKSLPHILSKAPINKKRIARDSTVTTYVNKIPIPALSKESYAKKTLPVSSTNSKDKGTNVKENDILQKPEEGEKEINCQKETQNEKPNIPASNEKNNHEVMNEKSKNDLTSTTVSETSNKRILLEENVESHKKQKVDESLATSCEGSVFKPIEPIESSDGIFCNLSLPNSINPSLSVSPTAAFLSSFPIVAPTRSEIEEENLEKKTDESKDPKQNNDTQITESEKRCVNNKVANEINKMNTSKENLAPTEVLQTQVNISSREKESEAPKEQIIPINNPIESNDEVNKNNSKNVNSQQPVSNCKAWNQFHNEIRSDTFYGPPGNNVPLNDTLPQLETNTVTATSFADITTNLSNSSYKTYLQQTSTLKPSNIGIQSALPEQIEMKNNHFNYLEKENYMNKTTLYNSEGTLMKKQCSNNLGDNYIAPKTQPTNYQIDSAPNYNLISTKENQRNSRTVNWMTEPDIRNRGMVYASQNDKVPSAKPLVYTQSDNYCMNNQNRKISQDYSGNFMPNDQNKINYQKNDFYGKDQRYKTADKRVDPKCYTKAPQNTYNIFDYNYSGSCYSEEDSNKYCHIQTYPAKNKKNVNLPKKKPEDIHQVTNENHSNDHSKRTSDQIISNIDFNPLPNQECFTWVPGKNVEWLPSKSFCLDTNLVVPSTLPTLVGDLALGTTSTNDIGQIKPNNSKTFQPNLKTNQSDINKDYADVGMVNNSNLPKPIESLEANKQYLEPFTNLSKNIFDVTPASTHTPQMPKNDFEKVNFLGNNNSETIVLKNIFELPVSKSSGNDFSRKQRPVNNNSQNTFLSVSQLVEPPNFEGNTIKNDPQMETTSNKTESYSQNYSNYNNQKSYKNKTRNTHCKYNNDRKYHGYKNGSSSYTAEALIRSNTNNYQSTEFTTDINPTYFNSKNNQKPEQFLGNNKIDFELNMKSDFTTGSTQNIYSDFNFSSPVPNFSIGPTVGTDFVNHDTTNNFPGQNNSFFGDFITPEYPLSESVSNSLLLPPCSIALQNPFVMDKRSVPGEKNKSNTKQCANSRNRKHYECSKTTFNDFSISSSNNIFTTASITCPPIFTTSACQNLLPVPTQSMPISFSSPSFTSSNISFPALSTNASNNYHRFPNPSQNPTSGTFLTSNTMFTTCTSKPLSSAQNCYTSNPLTSVANPVITSSFPVGNVPFSNSSQSSIPFFSLSNPIIPSGSTSSSNSLANFNLSTIFPEINQKGSYHYS